MRSRLRLWLVVCCLCAWGNWAVAEEPSKPQESAAGAKKRGRKPGKGKARKKPRPATMKEQDPDSSPPAEAEPAVPEKPESEKTTDKKPIKKPGVKKPGAKKPAESQAPAKDPGPAEVEEDLTDEVVESLEPLSSAPLSPEVAAQLPAIFALASGPYFVNGKAGTPGYDLNIIVQAAEANDPEIKRLGQRLAYSAKIRHLLQRKLPPPEIEQLARTVPAGKAVQKLEQDVRQRKTTLEEENRAAGEKAIAGLLLSDNKLMEKAVMTEPQQRSNLLLAARIVGQREFEQTKALLKDLASRAGGGEERKNAVEPKLDQASSQLVELTFINRTKETWHDVLVITDLKNDPLLVNKRSDAEIATRLALPAMVGASAANLEAGRRGILLENDLLQLPHGTVCFIPEIPAGGTVKIPIASKQLHSLIQSARMSLWCRELRITDLEVDIHALPIATGLVLDRGGNADTFVQFTRSDPIDTYPYKLGRAKSCQVFLVKLTKGKRYEIESSIPSALGNTPQRYQVCHLRVENTSGKTLVVEKSSGGLGPNNVIEFTPAKTDDYRIVCTAFFDESRCSLGIHQRDAKSSPTRGGSRTNSRPTSRSDPPKRAFEKK